MASDKSRLSPIKSTKSSQKSISNATNASLDDPKAGAGIKQNKKEDEDLGLEYIHSVYSIVYADLVVVTYKRNQFVTLHKLLLGRDRGSGPFY